MQSRLSFSVRFFSSLPVAPGSMRLVKGGTIVFIFSFEMAIIIIFFFFLRDNWVPSIYVICEDY